jgi:hypothetical protein
MKGMDVTDAAVIDKGLLAAVELALTCLDEKGCSK